MLGAIQDLGVAYGLAKTLYPDRKLTGIQQLVRDSLLALLDDELILFFRSSWDEGYSRDPATVEQLRREEVVAASEPEHRVAGSGDDVIFFIETQQGADVFAALPPELVERIREQQFPRT